MKLPKTVLFLCQYQAPYAGSFILSLGALEAELNARGTRCVWAFPAGAEARAWSASLNDGARAVVFLPQGGLTRFFALNRIVRRYGAELIHVHFGYFALASLVALFHRRLCVIEHVHSDFSAGEKPSLLRRLKRTLRKLLQSRRVRRIMVGAHMLAGEKRAAYVPNGVDFTRMEASAVTRGSQRRALGLNDDEKLVLLFGWSPAIKGVDVAARALMRLKDDGFVLGIVTGRDMTADKLCNWLSDRGCLLPNLRLLPPTENVFDYHKAADIMLSASRSETFSYALSEALYARVPCVLSDIPGTRWAKGYETATVFPSGDDAACAEALKKAAAGFPPAAFELARARVAEECSLQRWVEGVITVYTLDD